MKRFLQNIQNNLDVLNLSESPSRLSSLQPLLGPAFRGLLLQKGKQGPFSDIATRHDAHFRWDYRRDQPELAALYETAKQSQWDASTALDWSTSVDATDPNRELISDDVLPLRAIPAYRKMPEEQKRLHRHALLAWMLSQFLHGEQGALFAACQVTQAVQWNDGKLYGSTQVVDEGRHVEVFQRYLLEKMGKLYSINDNLYVVIDSLMTDGRWDIKFLGMQILIEGLALGAFGTIRASTKEPLLRELLRRVITDEARHVHYGVVALRDHLGERISAREREEREDFAFEMCLLMRNRFLAHEFYDEYYAHVLTRKAWNELILGSDFMAFFRSTMFRRILPNLKRIHLLSDRVRPHYERIGLLQWEGGKAAHELTAEELLEG